MVLGRKDIVGASLMSGVTVADRLTWPLKPPRLTNCSFIAMLLSWRVEYDPQSRVVKSGPETGDTVTGITRLWDTEPIAATIVRLKLPGVSPGVSWRSVLTSPFGLSVIPVENPAPARPVLGPTGASSWIVPSKPFKLVKVSIVSTQYPS